MTDKSSFWERNWSSEFEPLLENNELGISQHPGHLISEFVDSDILNTKEEIAIAWPSASHTTFFTRSTLKSIQNDRIRYYITGNGSDQFNIGLHNAQIWRSRSKTTYGYIGIDRKVLWIILDPSRKTSPVLRLAMPQTVGLIYAYLDLVPKDEVHNETIEARVEQGKNPIGGMPCPYCGTPLWPDISRYGTAILSCAKPTCGYTRKIDRKSATEMARLMGIICGECGSQVKGRSSYNGVFLGCTNYPECTWTMPIEHLV